MKKRVFALFTAMFLLCGMLAGCGPTGSSSTTTDGSDDGAKDTLIVAIPESPTLHGPHGAGLHRDLSCHHPDV